MKIFACALCSVALVCCLISSIEAAPERQKRSVGREMCPEKSTDEQCVAYAEGKSKTFNYCHRFISGRGWIEWQTCGIVLCGGNAVLMPEDLSKPYPKCCERCKVLDPSQSVDISGV